MEWRKVFLIFSSKPFLSIDFVQIWKKEELTIVFFKTIFNLKEAKTHILGEPPQKDSNAPKKFKSDINVYHFENWLFSIVVSLKSDMQDRDYLNSQNTFKPRNPTITSTLFISKRLQE